MSDGLVYSEHAQMRMQERGITSQEVDEAMANTFLPPPGVPSVKGHVWGKTAAGRNLRVTRLRGREEMVISVVAPEDVHESQIR